MLDQLVTSLGKANLKLNAVKKKIENSSATTEDSDDPQIGVLDQSRAFANTFFSKKLFHWHLVWFSLRYDYIGAIFCSWAPQILYKWCRKLHVHCRELFWRVMGPPADIDSKQPWHTILRAWHRQLDQKLDSNGFKIWSSKYFRKCKFAKYVPVLHDNRWVTHLALEPRRWKVGRAFFQWQTPMQNFIKFLPLASPRQLAWYCVKHWSLVPLSHRLHFLCPAMMLSSFFVTRFTSWALNGPPLGKQDQRWSK